jgi:CBS domain-containing protein
MHPISRTVEAGALVADLLRAVVDESHPVVAVVAASGRLLGTVSERDLLQCLPPAHPPEEAALAYVHFLGLRAVDVMAEAGPTVCADDPLEVALDLLAADRAAPVAVVDGVGRLCGLVDAASVAQTLCDAASPRH